jgi:hypothetical protein
MFKEIIYYGRKNKSDKDKLFNYYTISDDDFTEKDVPGIYLANINANRIFTARMDAVINCYQDKNLPVEANIILLMIFNRVPIDKQIKTYLEYCDSYLPYHNKIEKYLLLI